MTARRGVVGWLRGAVVEHLGLKLLALVLTGFVFLLVGSDEPREITVRVGVAYVLPTGRVLVSERVDEVKVTIKGPWRRIKRFDERELDRVTLDLTERRGGEVALEPAMFDLPDGLVVTSVEPRAIVVAFEDRVEREVEVVPAVVGRPAPGYAVVAAEVAVEPRRVKVRGPHSVVAAMTQVRTQDVAVDGQTRRFRADAALLAPPPLVELGWKDTVRVDVPITGQWRGPVRVVAAGDGVEPARVFLSPVTVEVVLTGPREAIDRALAGGVHPIARFAARPRVGAVAEVAVDGVSSGVAVAVHPAEVRVERVR
ncbi:MAG: hypothetical protein KBG48_31960 [Kofleriaceae bacterium]|jgi:YbbR domain-containing protein|nr:hypothetical protein [Kofleriaceae bacterium]MBP9172050.1 hypothetical protein [Kofleriaceae bacterium]MBP9861976.1 hypothetical protein [Kofleriaceae bacterium]